MSNYADPYRLSLDSNGSRLCSPPFITPDLATAQAKAQIIANALNRTLFLIGGALLPSQYAAYTPDGSSPTVTY